MGTNSFSLKAIHQGTKVFDRVVFDTTIHQYIMGDLGLTAASETLSRVSDLSAEVARDLLRDAAENL